MASFRDAKYARRASIVILYEREFSPSFHPFKTFLYFRDIIIIHDSS